MPQKHNLYYFSIERTTIEYAPYGDILTFNVDLPNPDNM